MRGAETILRKPLFSSALSRMLRLTAPPIEPSVMPKAPPAPVPTEAGKLTAKFGDADVPALLSLVEPPAMPTVDGKTIPVGLPV